MTSVTLSEGLLALAGRPVADVDLDRAALHLLDWLGCALAATPSPVGRALAGWGRAQGAEGACSALGLGQTGAEAAAFVNGGLGNLLEMDDLHRASILHAGDVVVPAGLAAGQAAGCGGPGLLRALLAGYEVALRIGTAAAAQGYSAWYNSASCGVFGAAVAAAQASGAPRGVWADALGLAGMQTAGLWQCRLEPSDGKQLATAHAARAGVGSAALAAAGLRGPREILEGRLGFFATLYPGADPAAVLDGPEAPWLLHAVSFKPWPACRHTHPAIAAALRLRAALPADRIDRVVVRSYAAALEFCDAPAPDSDHAARFSLQHAVAVTLLRGAPRLEDFGAAARDDGAVRALRDRIRLEPCAEATAAFPARMGATLEVWDRDGSPQTVACPVAPGDPEDPLPRDQIVAKFIANAGVAGLDAAQAEALVAAVSDLPRSADATEFWKLLGRAAAHAKEGPHGHH